MKKITVILLCVICALLAFGCGQVKEYKGVELVALTYKSVDFNGGYTQEYRFDFKALNATSKAYFPFDEEKGEGEVFSSFDKAKAKTFIDECYTNGLFSLAETYENKNTVIDGGSWRLKLEYADGTVSEHRGSNAEPEQIFNRCSTAFFDLCGREILGRLPSGYAVPPELDYDVKYVTERGQGSDNSLVSVVRGKYSWNGKSRSDVSYFEINCDERLSCRLSEGVDYEFSLYTANYEYAEKFKKCTLTSYNFDEELSGKRVEFSEGWFKSRKISLQLDKIYVYRLDYKNGNFVEYTFNTRIKKD